MKKCSKCGLTKSLSEFYRRKRTPRKGEYYDRCRECYKIRGRIYYHQNRERQLKLALKRKARYVLERKAFLAKFKNKPCKDCGKIYSPWIMDFDHRDGKTKIGSISNLIFRSLLKFDKIREEIEKCDLVCANCHRDRTYKRLHNLQAEVAKAVKAGA